MPSDDKTATAHLLASMPAPSIRWQRFLEFYSSVLAFWPPELAPLLAKSCAQKSLAFINYFDPEIAVVSICVLSIRYLN